MSTIWHFVSHPCPGAHTPNRAIFFRLTFRFPPRVWRSQGKNSKIARRLILSAGDILGPHACFLNIAFLLPVLLSGNCPSVLDPEMGGSRSRPRRASESSLVHDDDAFKVWRPCKNVGGSTTRTRSIVVLIQLPLLRNCAPGKTDWHSRVDTRAQACAERSGKLSSCAARTASGIWVGGGDSGRGRPKSLWPQAETRPGRLGIKKATFLGSSSRKSHPSKGTPSH